MKRITCKIHVGVYEFRSVSEVKINSSYETLTDIATLTVPRKLKFQGKMITGDSGILKTGDPVKIYLGYDHKNELLFSGYLTGIKPGSPLELTCEDEMYHLKKSSLSKSFKPRDTSLREVLEFTVPGYQIQCPDIRVGSVQLRNVTPAQMLNDLNRTYAFKSWFRNETLYVGLAYWPELQQNPAPVFVFSGRNANIIDHDLTYQDKETVRLKVKAISMNPNNTKTEVEVGDPEGEQRTLTFYDKSASELTEIAARELDRFRYTGYRGTFKSFGVPIVRHGDKVQLVDPIIKDRNGLYIAQSIETTFGMNGYKQEIELGPKV